MSERPSFREWFAKANIKPSKNRPPYLRGGLEPLRPSPVLPPPGPLFALPDPEPDAPPPDAEVPMEDPENVPWE